MERFRIEAWRIVKFLLITLVISLAFSQLYNTLTTAIIQSEGDGLSRGSLLSLLSYGYTFFSTLVLVLVHRYFTFRATEKWYIAAPLMVVCAFLWNWLGNLLTPHFDLYIGENIAHAYVTYTYVKAILWIAASYLLQRCVIYCHTTDTNGWYARFHPTNDEKGD